MRSMGDPDYEYRPTPDHVKEKQSIAQRKRLGIPDGCAQVYGQHVPLAVADQVRAVAAEVSRLVGREAAEATVKALKAKGWLPVGIVDPYDAVIFDLEQRREKIDDALDTLKMLR